MVQQSLEAFRQISATAVDLVRPLAAQARPIAKDDEAKLPPPGRLMVGRLIEIIIESPSLAEPFGPTAVAEATNRRFASRLREKVDSRTASDVLRRLRAAGEIELVRKGKAFYEALYRRRRRPQRS